MVVFARTVVSPRACECGPTGAIFPGMLIKAGSGLGATPELLCSEKLDARPLGALGGARFGIGTSSASLINSCTLMNGITPNKYNWILFFDKTDKLVLAITHLALPHCCSTNRSLALVLFIFALFLFILALVLFILALVLYILTGPRLE